MRCHRKSFIPRSAPDLWMTCDDFVGKVSAMGQATRPTQPSIPPGSVNSSNPCTYIDYGGEDHHTSDQGCVWLFGCGLGPRPIKCTPALSVTQKRRCSCGMPLVALHNLHKCYIPLPLPTLAIDDYKSRMLSICRARKHGKLTT